MTIAGLLTREGIIVILLHIKWGDQEASGRLTSMKCRKRRPTSMPGRASRQPTPTQTPGPTTRM